MASPLTTRLDKLEEKFPAQQEQQRVIRVIVQHDEDAGSILAAQGYDPDNGDFAIIRRIVEWVAFRGEPLFRGLTFPLVDSGGKLRRSLSRVN